jgi:two-component sensor histidine kinase
VGQRRSAGHATKYGGLSKPEGQVTVTWRIDRSRRRALLLDWRETGAGAIASPNHRGFGTELIEREITGTLGGKLELEYPATGMRASIVSPVDGSNVAPTRGALK